MYPNKVAVVFKNVRLTFAELNAQANQIAWYLVEQGAKPGEFVGLFLERSHYAVVAALAVFKTGAAYVPLDPAYPHIIATLPPLRPVSRQGLLPLTFEQRQLWIAHQIEIESPSYNIAATLLARGVLDEEALKRSLRALVARHEGLRTTFEGVEGHPYQHVHPLPDHIALLYLDMRALLREQRIPQAQRWFAEEAARSFDLAHGPLWRVSLLRLDEAEWVLGLVIHHIICDEWSMQLLQHDLFALYQQEAHGLPANLPHLDVQGVDLAQWQEQWMQSEQYAQQLVYWQRQLHALPSTDLLSPVEAVVQAVCPQRGINRTPLFQLKLVSLLGNQSLPSLPDVEILLFDFEKNTASFDLVIYLQEEVDGRLRLEWNYNTALFAPTTITRMVRGLLTLLPQLANQPEMVISK